MVSFFSEIESTDMSEKWPRKGTEEDRKNIGLRREEKGWNSHLESEKVNRVGKIKVINIFTNTNIFSVDVLRSPKHTVWK